MAKRDYKLSTDKRGELLHVRVISDHLQDEYEETDLGNMDEPFSELVYIILSVRTAEVCYQRAFASLSQYIDGDWDNLLELEEDKLAELIAYGGLADKKAKQILQIGRSLDDGRGAISMASFERLSTQKLVDKLCEFEGIGVKVAKCITMYAMDRDSFPIDIHCARVGSRIGWYEKRTRYTRRYADLIEAAIPASRRHRLHINLIQHGREVCRAKEPDCKHCCISSFCSYNVDRSPSFTGGVTSV